jgi:glycerol-3-phosphate acyltransferase PlsY
MAVVGHNYSVFLTEIDQGGKLIFRGGAGGAPALGGAIALWFPSWFIILPFAILVYLFVGYASITTISIAFSTTALFVVLVIQGLVPWQYIIYGVLALFAVTIALQPNLIALAKGSERMVGLRAYFSKRKLDRNPKQTP